ncbi:glycosyltransferase, partial [candidate division GN15 bacterium]|nr:glycosyltransferase [candidate division GN15 bacterium]
QTTIYNSVDLSEYPVHSQRPGKNIGYVGYINHKKGIGLLLQCLKAAAECDPEYRLHVAGTFQETRFEVYMTHLIEQMGLQDNVVMHGWVKDIPEWLGSMQYVVSTSPWEGCPLNLIEAMACGIKPLIHNWQGAATLFPRELVFNTVDNFVELLNENAYDSAAYRAHVAEHFNADTNVRRIDRYLKSVLDGRGVQTSDRAVSKPISTAPAQPERTTQNTAPRDEQSKPATINFYQPLARQVELSQNRKAFTIDFCKGKRVLHVGCVDAGIMESRIESNNFLHFHIDQVAEKLIGVDIEEDGLHYLAERGYDVRKLDLETDGELLQKLAAEVDVIVIPEVIEHLNNVGSALANLKACGFTGEILISTPNAFSFRVMKLLGNCVELVHPDHNYYYSPTTLKTLLGKHGLELARLVMYYWPTEDDLGRELDKMVRSCPYYAEGMLAIVRDPDATSSTQQ